MPDGIDFDLSEVTQLAADLGEVAASAGPLINSALQFTARNVKTDAAKTVGQRKHFKQAAAGIDYDVTTFHGFGSSVLKVDIGYNKGGGHADAAKLGNLVEFGSPGDPATNLPTLPPGNDLANALEKNTPDFQEGLEKALVDAERILTNSTGIKNIAGSVIRGSF